MGKWREMILGIRRVAQCNEQISRTVYTENPRVVARPGHGITESGTWREQRRRGIEAEKIGDICRKVRVQHLRGENGGNNRVDSMEGGEMIRVLRDPLELKRLRIASNRNFCGVSRPRKRFRLPNGGSGVDATQSGTVPSVHVRSA